MRQASFACFLMIMAPWHLYSMECIPDDQVLLSTAIDSEQLDAISAYLTKKVIVPHHIYQEASCKNNPRVIILLLKYMISQEICHNVSIPNTIQCIKTLLPHIPELNKLIIVEYLGLHIKLKLLKLLQPTEQSYFTRLSSWALSHMPFFNTEKTTVIPNSVGRLIIHYLLEQFATDIGIESSPVQSHATNTISKDNLPIKELAKVYTLLQNIQKRDKECFAIMNATERFNAPLPSVTTPSNPDATKAIESLLLQTPRPTEQQALCHISLLISQGANIKQPFINKVTPLYWAIYYQYNDLVAYLLNNDTDFYANIFGKTSLSLALENKQASIIDLLYARIIRDSLPINIEAMFQDLLLIIRTLPENQQQQALKTIKIFTQQIISSAQEHLKRYPAIPLSKESKESFVPTVHQLKDKIKEAFTPKNKDRGPSVVSKIPLALSLLTHKAKKPFIRFKGKS